MPGHCPVPGCNSSKSNQDLNARKDLSFHSLPSDKKEREKWMKLLNIDDDRLVTKWSRICSRHFHPSDFIITSNERRYLKKYAVPISLQLKKTVTRTIAILPKPQILDEQVNVSTKENLGTVLQNLEHANSNLQRVNEALQMQLNEKLICNTCIQLRKERDFLLKKLEEISSTGKLGWKCTSPGTVNCPHRELFMDAVKEIANLNETIEKLTRHRTQNIPKRIEHTSVTRLPTPAAIPVPNSMTRIEEVYIPTWNDQSETEPTVVVNSARFNTFNAFETVVPKQEPPDEEMSEEEYILPDACEDEPEVEMVVKVEPKVVQKNTFGDCVVPIDESAERKNSNEKARFYPITCRTLENGETEPFSEAMETARKNAEKNTAAQLEPQPETSSTNDETEKLAMVTRPMVLETAFGHFYVTPGVVRMKKIKKAKNLSPVCDTVTGKDTEEIIGHCDPAMDTDNSADGHLDKTQVGVPLDDLICKWCVPDETGHICGVTCRTRMELWKHAVQHVPKDRSKNYTCYWQNCPRNKVPFWFRNAFTSHIGVHTSRKTPRCPKLVRGRKELKYFCAYPDCREVFRTPALRRNHHLTRHSTDMRFKCAFLNCNRTFPSASALVKHTRRHTGEKPFACPFDGCGEKYAFRSALSDHVRVHKTQEEKTEKSWTMKRRRTYKKDSMQNWIPVP